MHTIIELLNEKNFCLEKFIRVNETEINNFTAGNFDNLEDFYATREGLLEIIKRIDFLIDEKNQDPVDLAKISAEFKKEILDAQRCKNDLVGQILQQDLEILSALENAKSEIIRELSSVRTNKKAIGSYKSGMVSSRLDEEA